MQLQTGTKSRLKSKEVGCCSKQIFEGSRKEQERSRRGLERPTRLESEEDV